MTQLQFIAPTLRKKMGRKEAARLFLLHNGICCNCGQQIRGRDWFIEHVVALVLGGADDDANRRPAHLKCKTAKDRLDAAVRADRDRHITSGYVPEGERPGPKIKSAGFKKSPRQRKASAPIAGKFPGDIMGRGLRSDFGNVVFVEDEDER